MRRLLLAAAGLAFAFYANAEHDPTIQATKSEFGRRVALVSENKETIDQPPRPDQAERDGAQENTEVRFSNVEEVFRGKWGVQISVGDILTLVLPKRHPADEWIAVDLQAYLESYKPATVYSPAGVELAFKGFRVGKSRLNLQYKSQGGRVRSAVVAVNVEPATRIFTPPRFADDSDSDRESPARATSEGEIARNADGDEGGFRARTRHLFSSDEAAKPKVAATERHAPDYKIVRVHYATDRQPTGSPMPEEHFGSERGILTYGTCDVSIPRDHRTGELESPAIWRLELREDPEKHVVLRSVRPVDRPGFLMNLSRRVNEARGHKLFVFVHGFNVSFADAARRTAQISFDLATELNSDVAPIFFSWPSQASLGLAAYRKDESSIEWSSRNLKAFLMDVASSIDSGGIYVVAHSMGTRAVSNVMAQILKERPEMRKKFREVILMAPDIDAQVFRKDIAPALTAGNGAVTVYASSRDKALIFSARLNGRSRLGEAGDHLTVLPGIETIDASTVETDLLGHSYSYAKSVLTDVKQILQGTARAAQRSGLQEVANTLGHYWRMSPE